MKRAIVWTAASLAALFLQIENACPQKQIGFHPGNLISADYSPDSRTLASGGQDGAVILWDAATGEKRKTLQRFDWRVDKVQFSPNGRYLVGYAMMSAFIWDVETGEKKPLDHVSVVTAGAFSPDDQTFAGSEVWDRKILVWDIKTGGIRMELSGVSGFIRTMDYSSDGLLIAAGGTDGVYIWNVKTAKMTASIKNAPGVQVRQIAFLPDDRSISVLTFEEQSNDAPAQYLGTAHLLNAETGALIRSIGGDFKRARLSPDGRSLVSENLEGAVSLWNVERGDIKAELEDKYIMPLFSPDSRLVALRGAVHGGRVWDAETGRIIADVENKTDLYIRAFAPDGSALAGSSDAGHGGIQIWNIANRLPMAEMAGHGSRIDSAAFMHDGLSVLSVSAGDLRARLWDVKTGGLKRDMEHILAAAASPDGKSAAVSFDRAILIMDPLTGKTTAELNIYSARAMAFSPDGRRLVFSQRGSHGDVRVWNIAAGEVLKMLTFPGEIRSIAFSPDGEMIAGAGDDSTILIWNASGSRLTRRLEGHESEVASVAFSPNRLTLASAGKDGAIRLWNLETGQTRLILQGHQKSVLSVAFSPDGTALASGGEDGTIRLWNAATGKLNRTIEARSGHINSVAFSPDGSSLVSGGQDGRVLLWRLENLPIQWSDIRRPNSPHLQTALLPNYPNPFNPETWIPFDLATQSAVTIAIYNAAGQLVRVLELGDLPAGTYRAKEKAAYWDGRGAFGSPAASGMYFVRIQAGNFSETRRMVLLK